MTQPANSADPVSALADFERELHAAETNLVDLDGTWTRLAAITPSFQGASGALLADVNLRVGSIWKGWTALQTTLARARQICDTAAGSRAPRELDDLVNGPSVVLDRGQIPLAQRTFTGSRRDADTVTPAEALQRLGVLFGAARDDLERLERENAEAPTAAAGIRARIATLLAPLDGLTPDDVDAARLRSVLAELDGCSCDPLTLATACRDNVTLVDKVESAVADLRMSRFGLDDRVGVDERALLDLQRQWRTARAAARDSEQRFGGTIVDAEAERDMAESFRALTDRLAEFRAAEPTRWRATKEGLDRWDSETERLRRELLRIEAAASAPIQRRSELRGLIDAARAKARDQGQGEDPVVTALADEALAMLRATPCDLATAQEAVERYVGVLRGRRRVAAPASGTGEAIDDRR